VQVGRYQVQALIDAYFGLDGGAMFGIVPRPLWEREQPPDARNRIRLACRCLLLRGDGRTVLIDTGIGDKWGAKERDIYAIEPQGGGLPAALAARSVAAADVTDVIQTHLHFDHAGGLTRREGSDGPATPTYPRATLHVQRRNWAWAHAPTPRDAGSYRADDFASYGERAERLQLVEGAATILPGIEAWPTDGHTPGQQAVRVRGADGQPDLIYCGDLFPTHSHLRVPWNMGYDLQPLTILEEKRALLAEASDAGHHLVLEHDPEIARVRVRFAGGKTEILERGELS